MSDTLLWRGGRSQGIPRPKRASLNDPFRHTGIGFLGSAPWRGHICLFYETKEDLLHVVTPYLKAGLASKEFCMWAVPEVLTEDEAKQALSQAVADFDRHLTDRSIEIFPAREWYAAGGRFDLKRMIDGWREKLGDALSRGYKGLRVSGDTAWLESKDWEDFSTYEREFDEAFAGCSMTALCTYPLGQSRGVDVLNVARIHQFTMALRKGDWEVIQTKGPETGKATERLSEAEHAASHLYAKLATLTARERMIFDQIIAGASSKELGGRLGISSRTVDFHRTNILRKLGAKNTADLLRMRLTK